MARTVHHVPLRHRDGECNNHDCAARTPYRPGFYAFGSCDYRGPRHAVFDLRYSAADLDRAERTGTRPVPSASRHVMPTHIRWERLHDDGDIGYYADRFERVARMRTREDLTAARGLVNAALRNGDTDAYSAADDLALDPVRHRGSAIWESW